MALQIYQVSPFDHKAEKRQFDEVAELLASRLEAKPCLLIGNYNIGGVELDAFLVTPAGFRILEFKNWGGRIQARENGPWLSDGKHIEGGTGGKNPFQQIRTNRSHAARGLRELLGKEGRKTGWHPTAAIIFGKKASIDDTQLSEQVKEWLTVCDNRHLDRILQGMETDGPLDIETLPHLLRIEEFEVGNEASTHPATTQAPETLDSFIGELERALRLAPDYPKLYEALDATLQRFLNQQTEEKRAHFTGTFAKVDYLLKEHEAPSRIRWQTNDTRVRMRRFAQAAAAGKPPLDEMAAHHRHDFRNLCEFMAFTGGCDVPASARKEFPMAALVPSTPMLVGECMRVVVEQWDDEFVYAAAEDSPEGKVIKVDYARPLREGAPDWSYLSTLFYKDAQLNLVRPHLEGGVYRPELIIFEPDYLVDVSSVARCFTPYADSPFVHLLHRLEPFSGSEATVLGNLASQFLDESIHHPPGTIPYAQSLRAFFETGALQLLTTPLSAKFHEEAQRQRQNIERVIWEELPSLHKDFNPKEGLVEPSFFSEMLGLQGRMDYLQLNYQLLMEQKSGKGGFPSDPRLATPKPTEEHYVQLMLYRAIITYNHRDRCPKDKDGGLSSYLLYSKFSEPLVYKATAPELLHKALKIRNELVWAEMSYTRPDGYRILEALTPENLIRKNVSTPLWERKVRETMRPFQEASPLEKAYVMRFLTFIANEHVLAKMGGKGKECSGFASMWQDTLEAKRQAGNILDGLRLLPPHPSAGGTIESVTLAHPTDRNKDDMANFRVGDIVVLHPYDKGQAPDARTTMVFRCAIARLAPDSVTLRLRAAQADGRVFQKEEGKLWALEHDFVESSFGPLYRGIYSLLSAPKERRDLLLLQRRPQADGTRRLKGHYGDFDELALRVKQAQDFFLIVGPPGTGKTSYGMLNTVKEELLEPGSCILLTAYTNRAVDEICGKLAQAEPSIDFVRLGSEQSCAEEIKPHLLSQRVLRCANLNALRCEVEAARIVVGTTTSLLSSLTLLALKQFSLCVIDEASQILEPHIMGLLTHQQGGTPSIRKFVMIGDHKQLPAVVAQQPEVSRVHEAALQDIRLADCRLSLFERLHAQYHDDPSVTYMLTRQGRMHPDIALFPNRAFYGGRLQAVPLPHQRQDLPQLGAGANAIDDLLATRRIAFIDTECPGTSPSDKVNQAEADIIAATVAHIHQREQATFKAQETVGVIVPYRNQIAAVRHTLDTYGIKALRDITIDTVERFQGSQRRYIVYGFTVQKYYQLKFLAGNVFTDIDGSVVDRKLNVAMTRAEEHLIMVGNGQLLANNLTFSKLLEFVRSRHGYFKLGKDEYVAGHFAVPPMA